MPDLYCPRRPSYNVQSFIQAPVVKTPEIKVEQNDYDKNIESLLENDDLLGSRADYMRESFCGNPEVEIYEEEE